MSESVSDGSIGLRSVRQRRSALSSIAAALLLALAACASIDAPPGPANVAPVAAAPRTTGGVAASPERKRLIDAFGGEYSAPATETYLNNVLAKLAPSSDAGAQPYRVALLNSQVVNAFALPSGDIFVTRGLLALAEDTSEIAAVMAHEISPVPASPAPPAAEFETTAGLIA